MLKKLKDIYESVIRKLWNLNVLSAYPKDTDEQIQERLERGDYQENFFAQQILNTKAAEYTTKAILLEAKETRQDLLKLETSMTELVGVCSNYFRRLME